MKRKLFLEVFLKALGAVNIHWVKIEKDKIFGTVIYDILDPEEQQDFVWHMTEEEVPSHEVAKLIEYLSQNGLIDIDRVTIPLYQTRFDFINPSSQDQIINELFDIKVRMIDDGEETDAYFLHN